MKKFKEVNMYKLTAFILALLVSGFSFAQAKFTCIDTNRILSESKLVAEAQGELRSKLMEYQNKLKKKEKRLEELKKQIESKAISEKVKEKKIKEYQKIESEARELQEKAQRELTEMRQRLENMVFNRVKEASEKIAKERGLAGILDCGAFIYRDPELDITTEVIKLIDAGKK
jgi:outer membrane protein